jgi:hypothetical protein
VVALAVLGPALWHGPYLGPYQSLHQGGLLPISKSGNQDLITQMIPWTRLSWDQVHNLHLPLWNPYNGFGGMPLAFDWQSATFALPTLVGYLFPVSLAFTVGMVTTLMVAGTGAYAFARVLGIGVIGAAVAGAFFELSGPLLGFLGYPLSGVMSWIGWLLAAAVLVVRGKRPARSIPFFAVTIAFTVYAGNPEALAVVFLALSLYLVVIFGIRVWRKGARSLVRPVGSLLLGGLLGFALSAPLALAGYQLGSQSSRTARGGHSPIPLHGLVLVLLPNGYRAIPPGVVHEYFIHIPSTIGFIAVPLAVVAVARCWRSAHIVALCILVVVFIALTFSSPLETIADHLPVVGNVYWSRALVPMAMSLAILAGLGAQILLRSAHQKAPLWWTLLGTAVLSLLLIYEWFGDTFPPPNEVPRNRAFIWPIIDLVVAAGVVASLIWLETRVRRAGRTSGTVERKVDATSGRTAPGSEAAERLRKAGVAALVVVQTVTLVVVGSSLFESSTVSLPSNASVALLQKETRGSEVGVGEGGCYFGQTTYGLPVETNAAYGIREVGVYDPIIPNRYFTSWQSITGESGGSPALASFCPTIRSLAVARQFGVRYLLTARGAPVPAGVQLVTSFPKGSPPEVLYRVPGAAPATVVPLSSAGGLPPDDAAGQPVGVREPNPSTWSITVAARRPSVLRLRLTNMPGWRATIDGRPLQLSSFSGVMLQARVPAGRHTVVVTYWPPAFTVGLILFALGVVAIVGMVILDRRTRKVE